MYLDQILQSWAQPGSGSGLGLLLWYWPCFLVSLGKAGGCPKTMSLWWAQQEWLGKLESLPPRSPTLQLARKALKSSKRQGKHAKPESCNWNLNTLPPSSSISQSKSQCDPWFRLSERGITFSLWIKGATKARSLYSAKGHKYKGNN